MGKDGKPAKRREFSNRAVHKEINFLARNSSKEKVLDLYSSVIECERAKISKKAKKRKTKPATETEESDSDLSVHIVDPPTKPSNKIGKKKTIVWYDEEKSADQTEEEKAFLKKVQQAEEDSMSSVSA